MLTDYQNDYAALAEDVQAYIDDATAVLDNMISIKNKIGGFVDYLTANVPGFSTSLFDFPDFLEFDPDFASFFLAGLECESPIFPEASMVASDR